jgi:pyruvate, orthophosphate dikinase
VDHLLQVLCLKGRATHEALGSAVEADPTAAIAAIAELEAAGLVESTKLGYRVTDLGRSRADELYAYEREQASPVIDDVYESFVPINDDIKQIVTDWQMRPVGGELTVNDHSDSRHDDRVIARLRRTDAKVSTALAPLSDALDRFDRYPRRLRRALTLIGEGDHSMLAAPLKDSYHTVWFELHEELIILSGRSRADVEV